MRAWMSLVESAGAPQFETIEQLVQWAGGIGVYLLVDDQGENLYLSEFERDDGAPKGSGAEALKALCAFADRRRRSIELHVMGCNGTLMDYYGRFGFQEDPDCAAEVYDEESDETDMMMVRPPHWHTA